MRNKVLFKTYRLEPLTPSQVKRLIVISDPEIVEAIGDFNNTTFYRNVFGLGFLAVLFLMLIGGMRITEGGGKSNFVQFIKRQNERGDLDSSIYKPQTVGSYHLRSGVNYLFKAKTSLPSTNQDVDFSISIIRKDDKVRVSEVDIAFFTESGTDDEGAWTEDMVSDEFKFQVDKTGTYEIIVTPDYEDFMTMPNCTLTVSVNETTYNFYYLWAASALLLATLIFQWQRENIAAYANLPHGTYLHDLVKQ